jgi:OOP family OmpA-OmpF porin
MFKKIAIAASLAIMACSASAQVRPSFYVGADVGNTKIDGLSGHQSSFGGFLGYQFNQNFAVEGGYRRLADFDNVTVNQTHVSAIGIVPLQGGFNIYGRLGYNNLDTKVNSGNTTDLGTGVLYGVGVGYNFTPAIAVRLEAQKPSSDSSNLGASLSLKF